MSNRSRRILKVQLFSLKMTCRPKRKVVKNFFIFIDLKK